MSKLDFDEFGNLYPYQIIEANLDVLQKEFVEPYAIESSRHLIFDRYLQFLSDFEKMITPGFTQWIGGSFVSQVNNPADLDFVTLIDFEIYQKKEKLIDGQFRGKGAARKYGLDAYTLRVYPESHASFFLYQSDAAYWYNLFRKTRKNRLGVSYKKGFLELKP